MLKNYKNFKEEIVIDFQGISGYQFSQDCITDGIISKMLIQQKILRDLLMNLKKYNFENLNYINAESTNIDRYIQSMGSEGMENEIPEHVLPFLRWLISNVALENDSILLKLGSYVRRMTDISASNAILTKLIP